jgi:hypothetical protein
VKGGMMYCGVTDIVDRWIYTRQGVHQLLQRSDFPLPVFTINRGRTKVWRLADIVAFEEKNPEVVDEIAKAMKKEGYARALRKKAIRKEKPVTADIKIPVKKEINGALLYGWL